MPDGFVLAVIKAFILINLLMGFAAVMTVTERKVLGRLQTRYGPNRVGPFGLLQPIADLGKMLQKQSAVPYGARRRLYLAAPFISLFAALAAFAVIPFGGQATIPGTDWKIFLSIGDSSVGVLYVAAVGSMGFYGMLIGGWAAGSKYSLLGGLRAVAQLISYEVAFTMSIIGVIMQAGTLSLNGIVHAQHDYWYVFPQIVGFLIFFTAALAESNRTPFDLAEADAELVAGFHTEYGGMRYGMFALAEYLEAITLAALGSVLFLGGWRGPFDFASGPHWLILKILLVLFVFMWIRATVPRLRYDRLMKLGWKVLLPIATLNLVVTAAWVALT
jgi:NADH-quinone oxidoreductase subunit H